MKFLIQKINGKIVHDFSFTLLQTIEFKNWLARGKKSERVLVKYFDSTPEAIDFKFKMIHRHYVPIGTVEFVQAFLHTFYELIPKPINVPEELFPFAHRKIFNGTEKDFKGKMFVKSNDKIKGCCGIFNEGEPYELPVGNYQFSDVVGIDSEWRAFVYNGKLIGLENYSGEFTLFPNVFRIKQMIDAYKSAPVAYTLDIGINDTHTYSDDIGTFVIECHDFFSCGLYGFNDVKYPNMLYQWFWQYVQREMVNKYEKNIKTE